MNYNFMHFVCVVVCSVTQWSYTGQNYHGIVRRDNGKTSAGITLKQYAQNRWDAIKKDHQEHYARMGNAHLQAGQPRNSNTNHSKKQ